MTFSKKAFQRVKESTEEAERKKETDLYIWELLRWFSHVKMEQRDTLFAQQKKDSLTLHSQLQTVSVLFPCATNDEKQVNVVLGT